MVGPIIKTRRTTLVLQIDTLNNCQIHRDMDYIFNNNPSPNLVLTNKDKLEYKSNNQLLTSGMPQLLTEDMPQPLTANMQKI